MTIKNLPFNEDVAVNIEHMSEETQTKIQEKAFELGYSWRSGHTEVRHLNMGDWLVLYTEGLILWGHQDGAREITLRELMETEVPTQDDDNEPITGYPGWVVGAKLIQTKPTPEVKQVTGPGFVDLRKESTATIKQLTDHLESLGYRIIECEGINWLEVLPNVTKAYLLNNKGSMLSKSKDTKYTVQDIMALKAPLSGEVRLPVKGISKSQAASIVDALYDKGFAHPAFDREELKGHHCWGSSGDVLKIDTERSCLWWDSVAYTLTLRTVSVAELMDHLGNLKAPEPELTEEEKIQQALPEELKGLKVGDLIRFTEEFSDTPEGYITEITGLRMSEDGEVLVIYTDSVGDAYYVGSQQELFEKLGKPNRSFVVNFNNSEALYDSIAEHLVSLGYLKFGGYYHGKWLTADMVGNVWSNNVKAGRKELTIAQVFQLTKKDVYV